MFKDTFCKIYHLDRGLIVKSKMTSNRMFMTQSDDIPVLKLLLMKNQLCH